MTIVEGEMKVILVSVVLGFLTSLATRGFVSSLASTYSPNTLIGFAIVGFVATAFLFDIR